MELPDELGVLADLHRIAIVEPFENIIWEIIANRKWNPDKSLAKFLFIKFGQYFILGTNHYRTKESIEKEHTPFKFNESNANSAASVSARGYGAKLFPFCVQGTYSTLFRMKDDAVFSSEINDWGMKEWIDLTELSNTIDNNKSEFNPDEYRSRYYMPLSKKKGATIEKPFFLDDTFINSPLDTFIRLHNFKYFYVFINHSPAVSGQLNKALAEMARVYENKNIELYKSIDLVEPSLITAKIGFGIHPSNWTGALIIDWRIGEKCELNTENGSKKYYKSEFRLRFHDSDKVIWGRNDSNGSADRKFALRFSAFKPESEALWTPQMRVTVALTTKKYRESIGSNDEKLQEYIYLQMENDLISRREADPTIASKLRNTDEPSRIRVIVEILEESLKTSAESGLVISNVKCKSNITVGKAIHENIIRSLHLMGKHLGRMDDRASDTAVFFNEKLFKDLEQDCHANKTFSKRSTARAKEALKFESMVSKHLEKELSSILLGDTSLTITWEDNDATISANHNLEGQAIDTLGKLVMPNKTIWFAIQSKDRESSIPDKELNAFIKTINSLKEKKGANDKYISILTLAKKKSFNYDTHEKMLRNGINTIIESEEAIGSTTESIILSQLEMLV